MPTASNTVLTAFATAMRQWKMHYEMHIPDPADRMGEDNEIETDKNAEAELYRECMKQLDRARE